MVSVLTAVLIGIGCFAVALVIGSLIGITYRKKVAERAIGSAEEQAKKIIEEGEKLAETKKKEALLEAKEEILRSRNEAERELKERRKEVSRLEQRAVSREETLDRKIENLEKKEDALDRKIKKAEETQAEIEELKNQQAAKLEEISGYTAEQAKNELLEGLVQELQHDAALRIIEIESQLKEEADAKAREIISLAIQRCAADHVSEATVSVVALPNDDMKGRIIGREGRNIRTIETLTGVDLIIDDTPEAITLSSFDPVRREVARLSLEKLITDGRIHPARIEEMVEKSRREVEAAIKQAGEKAVFEVGIHGISTEMVKLLGRLRYRTSYGQNVLIHSLEVAYLSGIIADELGVDSTLAKRAGLLHDIGKAMTSELEGSHVQLGVDVARKYKENKDVIHAIEAHHGDVEPRTLIAMIVQALSRQHVPANAARILKITSSVSRSLRSSP